jgi:PilZ domain-containing protein
MDHRRVERLAAGRSGLCRIESDHEVEWLQCRLIHVSMLGLGIDLQHPSSAALIGRDVTVEVSPFEDSVRFRLVGSIREVTPMARGTIRVGIAFGRLSTSERYMIDVLTWSQVDVKIA